MRNVGPKESSEETAAELVEPGKRTEPGAPSKKSELSEPSKKSLVEERPTIQSKPHQSRWRRRFTIGVGVLAILYLAWEYILPLLR
jgi:hypothetical protein